MDDLYDTSYQWSNDYLLKLVDQTGRKTKYFKKCLTREEFIEICKVLNINENQWYN